MKKQQEVDSRNHGNLVTKTLIRSCRYYQSDFTIVYYLTKSASYVMQMDGSFEVMTMLWRSEVHSMEGSPDFWWTTTRVRSSRGWCKTRRRGLARESDRPDSRSSIKPKLKSNKKYNCAQLFGNI